MRMFIIMLLFLAAFCSCKDRFETIGQVPTTPSLKIYYNDSLLTFHRDSIKLSNPNYSYFGIDLRLSDSDRYYTSLNFSFDQGKGKLIYRSDTLLGPLLPYDGNRCLVKFVPIGEGLSRLTFKVSDQLHNSSQAILELLAFTNLSPISNLKISPIKSVDPLEYLLDASASFDADKHFGGTIIQYIYQVEGQTITTSQNQIKHIFASPGVYTISLQTKDNDGGLSSVAVQQVSIN